MRRTSGRALGRALEDRYVQDYDNEGRSMTTELKVGDRVSWNSEAGRVTGIIRKKIVSPVRFKGYVVRASEREPQYMIESEKTDHVAVHKRSALRKLKPRTSRAVAPRRPRTKSEGG
jgi:Hypervirulence associated proteins TUDOR domain